MFIPLHDDNPLRHLPRPYVNYTLIGVTTLCFLMSFLASGDLGAPAINAAAIAFGFIPSVVNDYALAPQYVPATATYLTYAFLHADWWHLIGNMAFLWVFGDNIEDALGHLRYLAFYIACAMFAALVHSLSDPQSTAPLIGASGAVAGVVGAYLVLHPRVKLWILLLGRIPVRLSAMWVLGGWVVFQFFSAAAATEADSTAWWAHIGGLIAGAVLIVLLRRPGVVLFDRNLRQGG